LIVAGIGEEISVMCEFGVAERRLSPLPDPEQLPGAASSIAIPYWKS